MAGHAQLATTAIYAAVPVSGLPSLLPAIATISALCQMHGLNLSRMAETDCFLNYPHERRAVPGFGQVERRALLPVFGIEVRATRDQQPGGIRRAVLHRPMQGGPAKDIGPVHIGPEA